MLLVLVGMYNGPYFLNIFMFCRDSSFGSTGDVPQSSTLRLHARLDQAPAQAGGSVLKLSTRLEAGEARTAFNEDQVST